jgi:hypothetical protein
MDVCFVVVTDVGSNQKGNICIFLFSVCGRLITLFLLVLELLPFNIVTKMCSCKYTGNKYVFVKFK